MKKSHKWLIIDENNKIIDSFRYSGTAKDNLPGLKKICVGATLKIINIKDYNAN